MIKKLTIAVLVLIFILITGCASKQATGGDQQEKITLQAISSWEESNILAKALFLLQEKVEKKSNGKLTIKFKGGPEAIPTTEQGEAVRNGIMDMALTTSAYYSSQVPEAMALDFSTKTAEEERKSGALEFLSKIHEEKMGVKILGRAPGRSYAIYTSDKVEKMADLKGMRIRGTGVYEPVVEAMQMNRVNITPSETYTALDRGVIKAVAWPNVGITDLGLEDHLKYKIQPYFYQNGSVFIINKSSWDKLPKDLQNVLIEAVQEVEKENPQIMKKVIDEENDKIMKKGMKITKLQDADEFLKIVNEASWKWLKKQTKENGDKLQELFGPTK